LSRAESANSLSDDDGESVADVVVRVLGLDNLESQRLYPAAAAFSTIADRLVAGGASSAHKENDCDDDKDDDDLGKA